MSCSRRRQSTSTGTLRVTVRDSAGRLLAGAHGTLYGPRVFGRPLETAADGTLTVSDLAFGRYALVLSQPGFGMARYSFTVDAQSPAMHDVVLTVGGVNTTVTVIASTPIGSLDVPLSDVPLPVQTLSAQTLEDTNAIDLTDAMKRRLNGVYVNENQNNPFQPDINYRGYTASPLVGAPAGLSVYLDGVRQNQPFGDVVQWDLIPKGGHRLDGTDSRLEPCVRPEHAGRLHCRADEGRPDQQRRLRQRLRRQLRQARGGHGIRRQQGSMELVRKRARSSMKDGWRVQSPSSVKQSFAKLGYNSGNTVLSLSGGYSINNLVGNGTQDVRALNRTTGLNHGYNSVYSIPDATYQHAPFVTLNATQALSRNISINLNAYLRYARQNSANGDFNDDSFDESLYTLSTKRQDRPHQSRHRISHHSHQREQHALSLPALPCREPGTQCRRQR